MSRVITINVEPKEAYIERRGGEQRINFDLLIHNTGTLPLRIKKVQVSVYAADGSLAFRRYLDENGVPSGVSTIPERVIPAGGSLDVFNPVWELIEQVAASASSRDVFVKHLLF